MDPDQTITDVEAVAAELARVKEQFDRLLGQLETAELQLDDARHERNHEHRRAEALQVERDQEHQRAETFKLQRDQADQLVAALKIARDYNAAIDLAIGTIAGKAGLVYPEARSRLKDYSSSRGEHIRAVAERLAAHHEQAAPLGAGDPEITHLIAAAGVPVDFWNALTLNGAIFE